MDKWNMTGDPRFNELFDTWVDKRIRHFEEVEKPQIEERIRVLQEMSNEDRAKLINSMPDVD